MNKTLQTIKTITLAFVLTLGLSYAYAWTGPTTTPPGGNTPAPINTSAAAQTKAGQLTVPKLCLGTDCRSTWPTGGSGNSGLTGSGTSGYLTKWTSASSVGNSKISEDTNGNLDISGNITSAGNINANKYVTTMGSISNPTFFAGVTNGSGTYTNGNSAANDFCINGTGKCLSSVGTSQSYAQSSCSWVISNTTQNDDNRWHQAVCPTGTYVAGIKAYATLYLDGPVGIYCCN